MSGIVIDRFEDGKIVEEWPGYDLLGVMQKLGAVPTLG
jgi:predicted ester cyclase